MSQILRVLKMRESSAAVHSLVEWKVDKHVFKSELIEVMVAQKYEKFLLWLKAEDSMTFTSWDDSSVRWIKCSWCKILAGIDLYLKIVAQQIRSYFQARLNIHGLEGTLYSIAICIMWVCFVDWAAADQLGKRAPPLRDEDVDNEEEELFFSSMRKRRRKHFRLWHLVY